MRKINSIGYGSKILIIILILLILIPTCLFFMYYFISWHVFITICKISIVIGVTLSILFSIMLTIELKQDKKLNKYYADNKKTKLLIDFNRYECQSCGNTKLKASDTTCSICGVKFKNREDSMYDGK